VKRGGPLKRSEFKRGKPLRSSKRAKVRRMTPDPVTPEVRAEVKARSHGRCEARLLGVCTGSGQHAHHRKLRGPGDHRAVNLLDVCLHCHDCIHAHPAKAYLAGLLLRSTDDPEQVRVVAGATLS